ncbi:glutathione ABC transporter substrate-binding protein [Evansella sp. AB-rgal1]|uniref:glutathione ABC transporter substrate-binding protein n=1 Tax=Evansella sp. AB-rgal1 TaxID=3242696 RepID=UPI00359DA6DA
MNFKKIRFIALVFGLFLFLAACAGNGTPSTGDTTGNNDNTENNETNGDNNNNNSENGGDADQDLIIAVPADLSSLSVQGSNDVPSSNVKENIFETLVYLDENAEPQPRLATNWELIDDTTWHFDIREGVKFHDGSDLNAEVVKATFDRLIDPEIGSAGAFLLGSVDTIEVVSDYVVEINLKYPFGPFINHLAHGSTAIMSGEIIAADAEAVANGEDIDSYISSNPMGTGPFKLEKRTPGDETVLTKNEEYWGDPVALNSITYKVVPEVDTRIAELQTGAVHIADAIGPQNVNRVNDIADVSVLEEESTSINFVGFNTQVEPFDNPLVRQAITLAIDQQEIVEGIYYGTSVPAVGPIPPAVFGFDPNIEGLGYDMDKAKELMAEAGYADGFEVTLKTNHENTQRMDIAIYIEYALSELGITVNVEGMEFGAFVDDAAGGNTEMFILGWSTPTMDGDYATHALFHSDNHGQPGNMTFFDNAEIDEILDTARQESDPDVRLDLYSQAQKMLVEQAPMVYLNHTDYIVGVSDSVSGFGVAPNGIYQFRGVSLQ